MAYKDSKNKNSFRNYVPLWAIIEKIKYAEFTRNTKTTYTKSR
ncbi:hypothetical protein CCYN49044_60081 [Capnocytophaga cynodegmi]|nr:hypothetical protein CCYN49044_60081 [Capnocytophaga cynodegmi]